MAQTGYLVIGYKGMGYLAHRLAWLYMTDKWPKNHIDHKDGNKVNNRWENLRAATKSQNGANSKLRIDNACGFKGVRLHRKSGRWMARIRHAGVEMHLGYFSSPEDAHAAYCSAGKKYHGEYFRPK